MEDGGESAKWDLRRQILPKQDRHGFTMSGILIKMSRFFQAVGTSFVEHHLTIEQLKDLYPDSYIHHEFPERSDGLNSEEAR